MGGDLSLSSRHIALGYIVQLRESGVKDVTLKDIHEEALAKLMPGGDYDIYISHHGNAFNYL